MTIYSFGSINADLFYHVDHLPIPGETLTATDHTRSLGGKGANLAEMINIGINSLPIPLVKGTAGFMFFGKQYNKTTVKVGKFTNSF